LGELAGPKKAAVNTSDVIDEKPLSVKITGRTVRIKGCLDLKAAEEFFRMNEEERRNLKFINLSDVSFLYPLGLLPICAWFLILLCHKLT
jgi:hypothetical protein